MEVSGYTTIDNILRNVWSDQGESATEANQKRYFQWVIRGYKLLRLYTLPLDKAVPLQVQSGIRCVILPQDFVSFTAIGKNYNNHFHRFSLKPGLIPSVNYVCGIEEQIPEHPYIPGGYNYADGGGENLWYYKQDLGNNRILIDGMPLTTATLVYKSTGVNFDGATFIPKLAEEALIAYVHWQEALNGTKRNKIDVVDAQLRKTEWQTAVTDIQIAELNIDSLMDAVYSSIYQGVKR